MSPSTATAPALTTPEPKATRPKLAPGKPSWQVVLLPVDTIAPSPYQPRILFDAEEMLELVASVREHGVQQPILVRTRKAEIKANGSNNGHAKNGTSKAVPPYELVAGERRLRACREAGRKHIPAIVRDDLFDSQAAELALSENVQRSNLSVIEEARGYKQLMLRFRMNEQRIAKKVGKSVATIQQTMKLLALPEAVQQLLAYRKLTAAHGHALLPLASHEQVCTLVAHHAATNAVTAASLSQTLLPNQQELKRKGLLQELDYRTKFDWRKECKACPYKAYVASGYASFCLKPDEWKKKQEAAVERAKDEAAQAMERVREEARKQEQDGQVDVTQLPPSSYRHLTHVEVPQGCTESCPCRQQIADPRDATKTIPVCLNTERFKSLKEAERQAHEDARKRRYTLEWQRAVAALQSELEAEQWRKLPVLLCALVLRTGARYGNSDTWETLARGVAREVGLALPWDELFSTHDEVRTLVALESAFADDAARSDVEPTTLEDERNSPHPSRMLLFAAALLLADEASTAVRYGGETPRLTFILGTSQTEQRELAISHHSVIAPQDDETLDNRDEQFETESNDSEEDFDPENYEEQDDSDDWSEDESTPED